MKEFIAHKDKNKSSPHYLKDHSEGTMILAKKFSLAYDSIGLAPMLARVHDFGKFQPAFQVYIHNPDGRRGTVKHALPGAYLFSLERKRLPDTHQYIAYLMENIVAGHHRGLYDLDRSFIKRYDGMSDIGYPPTIKKIVSKEIEKLGKIPSRPEWKNPDYLAVLTRFSMSALVDADWLDTERYFNPELALERGYEPPTFDKFQHSFHSFIKALTSTELSHYREQCEQKGNVSHSYFELNLPTGYGKTFASLAFALEHAKTYSKSRIIVALPLINLTSELSGIYRDIFGEEHVIEDHSAFRMEAQYRNEQLESKMHLATENYNRKFIITTTVQLFESLFSNQPSKLRKVHRIANSVLILDEYHLLPAHTLTPILKMLDILQEYFGVTVLLVSATPLPLTESITIEKLALQNRPISLLEKVETPRRVTYHHLGVINEENLLEMLPYESTLVIVNTRKRAQQLYQLFYGQCSDRPVFHLSTALIGKDRAQRLEEIKKSLRHHQPLVIATSILEVGTDISFNNLYRELAPLSSIIQAAGRCNRKGEAKKGNVYLFEWENPIYPSSSYRSGIAQLRAAIDRYGMDVFYSEKEMALFYKRMLSLEGKNPIIKDKEVLLFETVAKKFKLIESQGITVVCENTEGFNQDWLKKKKTRNWWKKIQPYTVQVPEYLQKHIDYKHEVPVWAGSYDKHIGIPF
ncbi:CRISPR-associated helicase/endonuclease Cas3 [Bacillus niameyensis]|uniref:CRISPR-associated helicase/endonuclease Cas3 n=1 Tax=Bacillus niameyensis TaxID=1522308 RepID=UPI000783BC6D|nr:CRISPR-associated helicase/endonuclease Cas3 [Bacillus niameyensis]